MISIVTASRLNPVFLSQLFQSLQKQTYKKFEVLLCVTNPQPQELHNTLLSASKLNLQVVSTHEPNIASARNKGIKKSVGDVILFLDEDCFLPRKNYLEDVAKFHRKNPTFACGGFYRNPQSSFAGDRFYNFICNAWVHSHQDRKNSPPVLLGGCSFYSRQLLLKNKVFFDETNSRAGEEYLLNASWSAKGLPVLLSPRWSVFHQPGSSFLQVFRKSWKQGAQIQSQNALLSIDQLKKGWGYLQSQSNTPWSYLPLLGIYSAIGRVSFLKTLATTRSIQNKHPEHKKREWTPSAQPRARKVESMTTAKLQRHKLQSKRKPPEQSKPLIQTTSPKISAKTELAP